MLDWELSTEEADESSIPTTRPPRAPWLWLLVVAAALAAGAVLLRGYLADQQRLVREDLLAVVRQEERIRAAGQPREAESLLASGVEDAWRMAYLASFEPRGTPARQRTVALGEVEVEGSLAIAEVMVDSDRQLRAYQRQGSRWRRTPLPDSVWGAWHERHVGGLTLRYHARDARFAESLVPLIEAAQAEGWGEAPYRTLEVRPNEFDLQPNDTLDPRLVLNSPLLIQREGALDGEATARLAVARAMRPLDGSLVGAPRNAAMLRTALREVAAMRSALSPATYVAAVELWQAATADEWESAFFRMDAPRAVTRATLDSAAPTRPQAHALLTAHALIEQFGVATAAQIVQESGARGTWDALFRRIVGRYTIEVEQENRRLLGLPAVSVAMPSALPDLAAVGSVASEVEVPSLFDWPVAFPTATGMQEISINASNAALELANGNPTNPECIGHYSSLRVEGDWLDGGKTLLATRVTLESLRPPADALFQSVSPDGVAFLSKGASAYVIPAPLSVVAVTGDGSLQPLFESETAAWNVFEVERDIGQPGWLLFIQNDARCLDLPTRLYLYEAGRGVIGRWTVTIDGAVGFRALASSVRDEVIVAGWQQSGPGQLLRLGITSLGETTQASISLPDDYLALVGWSSPQEVVVVNWESQAVARLNLDSGELTPLPIPLEATEGTYLVVTAIEENSLYLNNMRYSAAEAGGAITNTGSFRYDLSTGTLDPFPDETSDALILRAGHRLLIGVRDAATPTDKSEMLVWDREAMTTPPRQIGASDSVAFTTYPLLCGRDELIGQGSMSGAPDALYRWTLDKGLQPLGVEVPAGYVLLGCP